VAASPLREFGKYSISAGYRLIVGGKEDGVKKGMTAITGEPGPFPDPARHGPSQSPENDGGSTVIRDPSLLNVRTLNHGKI
jgi:hypothetical protein